MLEVRKGRIGNRTHDGLRPDANWQFSNERCWFVRVVASDGTGAIPMQFARKQDAEMAIESIKDLDSWEGSLLEIRERMASKMTVKELKRRMVENLAW